MRIMCWRVVVVLDILCYGVEVLLLLSLCAIFYLWACEIVYRVQRKCIYSIAIMYELWTSTHGFYFEEWEKNLPLFFYYSFLWIWICFLGFLSTIKAVEFGSICFSGFSLYFWQCFVFVNSGILGVFLGFRKSLWVPKGRPHEAQFGQIQKPDPQYFFYFFFCWIIHSIIHHGPRLGMY